MTIILDRDLEGYFDSVCPFNSLANKPKHTPALSACLKALEYSDIKGGKW